MPTSLAAQASARERRRTASSVNVGGCVGVAAVVLCLTILAACGGGDPPAAARPRGRRPAPRRSTCPQNLPPTTPPSSPPPTLGGDHLSEGGSSIPGHLGDVLLCWTRTSGSSTTSATSLEGRRGTPRVLPRRRQDPDQGGEVGDRRRAGEGPEASPSMTSHTWKNVAGRAPHAGRPARLEQRRHAPAAARRPTEITVTDRAADAARVRRSFVAAGLLVAVACRGGGVAHVAFVTHADRAEPGTGAAKPSVEITYPPRGGRSGSQAGQRARRADRP